MVTQLIGREFGVQLSLTTAGRVLHKLDMSPLRPGYRAGQADPGTVEVWKAKTYPKILTQAKRRDAAIYFEDVSSVRTDYHAGMTWAAVGPTLWSPRPGPAWGSTWSLPSALRGATLPGA